MGPPPLQEPEVEPGRGEHDGEEDPAHRGGVAEAEELPRLAVDVVDGDVGGAERAALGHDVDEAEDLERPDHRRDEDEEEGVAQAGQRDVAEALQRPGAVDAGGVVPVAGDRGESGLEDDHLVADDHPHADQHQACEGDVGRGQPRDRADAGALQELVDEAVAVVEEPLPDHRDGDDAGDARQEEGEAGPADRAPGTLGEEREGEGDGHREGDVQREDGGVADGGPPSGI